MRVWQTMKTTMAKWEVQRTQEIAGQKSNAKVVNLWQRTVLKDKHAREVGSLSAKIDAVRCYSCKWTCSEAPTQSLGRAVALLVACIFSCPVLLFVEVLRLELGSPC